MTSVDEGVRTATAEPTAAEVRAAEDAGRLSTRPVAPGPAGPGARATVRQAWRRLTSMRTALQLLFLLGLAAVPGGLLPQRGQQDAHVQAFLRSHRTIGPVLDRLSLFDVFAAPWFAAVYVLLFVSLVGCLVPRIRLHARALRTPPPRTPARLSRLPGGAACFTDARPVPEVLAAARGALRGWRVVPREEAGGAASLAAERGYARETGNLVFHVSLVVLLVGVAAGSLFGYEGDRVLAEGGGSAGSFADTAVAYDQFRPGHLVGDGSLSPWQLRLDSFVATYRPDGSPADYVAHTTYTDPGGRARAVDIRVNHPLQAGSSTKVYLLNHGYAPVFALKDASGTVVQTSQPVICSPLESRDLLSRCELSFGGLPRAADGSAADLAFDVDFAPTGQLTSSLGLVSTNPALVKPVFAVTPYVGDLGTPANVESLDYRLLKPLPELTGAIIPRDPALATLKGLPHGYSLSVVAIQQWASFQVKHDPGKRLVLLAAIGMVGGLLASLRVRRRRLWVRAVPAGPGDDGGRTVVEVGGLARTDQEAFQREVDELVARLRGGTAPTGAQDDEEVADR